MLRETFTSTGRKVNLYINPKWICIRVSGRPCKVYFSQEDFDNDENYIGINDISTLSPYGEWKSRIDSGFIWIRGFNGLSDVELVCTAGFIEDYNTDYFSGSGTTTLLNNIQFTTTVTGTITIALTGINGTRLIVDPGDGTAYDTVNFTGGSTPWVHDYGGAPGTKTVKFFGTQNIINFNSTGFALGIAMANFQQFAACTNMNTTGSTITGDASLFNDSNYPVVTNLIIRQSNLNFEPYQFASLSDTLSVLYIYQNNGHGDLGGFAALENVTILAVHTNPYTYLNTTAWPAYNAVNIQIHNCLSTASEVDRFLIDGNDSVWTNCTIKADGTNPAPTVAAAVAIAQLTARGCTVTVN